MSQVILDLPEDSIHILGGSPEAAGGQLRLAAAMKLYELGRISSGAASELAGISKPEFLTRLAEYGIDTFRQSDEQLGREFENA